ELPRPDDEDHDERDRADRGQQEEPGHDPLGPPLARRPRGELDLPVHDPHPVQFGPDRGQLGVRLPRQILLATRRLGGGGGAQDFAPIHSTMNISAPMPTTQTTMPSVTGPSRPRP